MIGGAWWVGLAVAGGLGAVLRYLVDGWTSAGLPDRLRSLPLGIGIVNVSGSLLIGVVAALFASDDPAHLLLATGFCGGYTTFSTAMLDTVRLVRAQRYVAAFGYTVGSLALSIGAVAVGAGIVTVAGRIIGG